MYYIKFLLFPFSVLYFLVTSLRNWLFDHRILAFKPSIFDIFTVSVGNLSVGGTGKTPHIEYLIRLLSKNYNIATLSRGYGRKTRGIIIADENATAETIGDEPMQFLSKYGDKIDVVVGEQRSVAIPYFLQKKPKTQAILLDDAYQHRWVSPHVNILLTDFSNLFFKDYILPMGRLRESRNGVKRADMIIITKCPEDVSYKKDYIKIKLSQYVTKEKVPIFFTSIVYGFPKSFLKEESQFDPQSRILMVTGIANPLPLRNYLKENLLYDSELLFADHHAFTQKDINAILKKFNEISFNNKCIIVTEKDMVKLRNNVFNDLLKDIPIFYIPIEIKFLEHESAFQRLILKGLK